jgi:hypothetical protein
VGKTPDDKAKERALTVILRAVAGSPLQPLRTRVPVFFTKSSNSLITIALGFASQTQGVLAFSYSLFFKLSRRWAGNVRKE